MIVSNNTVKNDLDDWRTLAEALKRIQAIKCMVEHGFKLSEGSSSNGQRFIGDILKSIIKDAKYLTDYIISCENTERTEIIIFPEPMKKDKITLKDFETSPKSSTIVYEWVDDDYKLFLDTMQQSYCTEHQTINWKGHIIDRSCNDRWMAKQFGDELKSKGYVTRAIIKYSDYYKM